MMEAFYSIDNYPFNRAESEKNFHEFISNPALGRFWLLHADIEIIGYLILAFGYSFEYGGRDAFIDDFFLKEPFRGKGLGHSILSKLDGEATKLEVKAIHLEVENTNERGRNLYTKTGFKGNDRSLLTKRLG